MATKKIQISCPNCRQPITAESQQIFDTAQEPDAKQLVLSGAPNLVNCPICSYQGPFQVPLIYHDPDKDLLLTHVPQELGLPLHEQERILGPLINQVVDSLPQESRKGYLLTPKTMLTMQTMVETILEADGITKEMMRAQQEKVQLLQRMAGIASREALEEVVRQEDESIDREFFQILSTLMTSALSNGQEALARRLADVQEVLVSESKYGKEIKAQTEEIEAVAQSLQGLGQQATRDDLLDLVLKASSDVQLQAYVSMARSGMDYQFFQLLSERIDRARGDGRKRLSQLRESLLELTRQYDEETELQLAQARQDIEAILEQPDMRQALLENSQVVNDLFYQLLHSELDTARKQGDLMRSGKLKQLIDTIQELSAPPPETELINQLVEAEDDAARREILESVPAETLPSVLEMMTNLVAQVENGVDAETAEKVRQAYRAALRHSMRMNLEKPA